MHTMTTKYKHKTNIVSIDTYLIDKELLASEYEYTVDEMKEIYKTMLYIRRMEEIAEQLYKENKIRGFCHLATGQESIYAAFKMVVSKHDTSTSSYRCHGMSYATGDSIKSIFAEMLGRKDGMCSGKGGSMHLYNKQFYGGHGIVGAQVPISLGLAFSHKYRELEKSDNITKMAAKNASFAFYGDGAANQGQIYESYNMAMLWKLPIVFVCENNEYGMWTNVKTASGCTDFYKRGTNIPGIRVDHSNVFDLMAVFKFCRNYVLRTSPIIMEILTYRHCTHSARDQRDFRSKDELSKHIDVIEHFRSFLLGFIAEVELTGIEKSVRDDVHSEVDAALSSSEPSMDLLYTNVLLK